MSLFNPQFHLHMYILYIKTSVFLCTFRQCVSLYCRIYSFQLNQPRVREKHPNSHSVPLSLSSDVLLPELKVNRLFNLLCLFHKTKNRQMYTCGHQKVRTLTV
ncbi:hypothetical protein ILYODFUR_011470 [Ilyodon furcidens]|uniref:Secreted protein n=1 Tax=Ilyodon furcidens TaxID=33524 RepID=A0ABV0V289_9TELE